MAGKGVDRAAVVNAAFALVDRDGLDGLTMRALAKRLGVANPALYWHFEGKQQIVDLMAARLMERAEVPRRRRERWDRWLERAAWGFRKALRSCRDGPRIVASADLASTVQLQRLELAVATLTRAGLKPKHALLAAVAVFDFTLGATFEADEDPRSRRRRKLTLPPDRYPALEAAFSARLSEDDTFAAGLRFMLDGIRPR